MFAAFVPGHGQEIARGGRYDGIGEAFGNARPAIGFSTDLKTLVSLGETTSGPPEKGIFAPWRDDPLLQSRVNALRREGHRVVFELPGQTGNARTMCCDRVLVRRDDGWDIESIV